jgi:hypothetical protein
MKLIKLILLTVGLYCFASQSATAADILQIVSLNVTTISQNTNATSDATTTNVPAPVVSTHTTAEYLARLAQDEQLEKNWPSNSFPEGARLALVPGNNNPSFAVVLDTNVLLDVSDIISFNFDNIEVFSGRQNLQTGVAIPTTRTIHLGSISFDDRGLGNPNGSLRFSLQGIFTETVLDTVPNNGVYTETHIVKMANGSGDGRLANVPFVCTGAVSTTGKVVF